MEIPTNGFYYHYKRDPNATFNDFAYEVTGLARNTEDSKYYVQYRPLFESSYIGKAHVLIRPLEMFTEEITALGKNMPRFEPIADADLIAKLSEVRTKMYE